MGAYALILDAGKVADKVDDRARRAAGGFGFLGRAKEPARLDLQHFRDLRQAAGAHPVCTGLVFLDLLVGNAERVCQLVLCQAKQDPAAAHALTYLAVHCIGVAQFAAGHDFTLLVHLPGSGNACPGSCESEADISKIHVGRLWHLASTIFVFG